MSPPRKGPSVQKRIVHQCRDSQGLAVIGWSVFCPGCKEIHHVNTTWTFNGDLDRPTFSPSLLVNGDTRYFNPAVPRCHSFVRDGQIEFLSDCTHEMAGQMIALQPF